jgi:cytochrome c553
MMAPIAQALSPDDADDVVAYYTSAQTPFPSLSPVAPDLVTRGRQLAVKGDPDKGVPACDACHGSAGVGEAPGIPYLGGQYANYTASQLQMWRNGSRKNSLEAMELFAGKLDDHEIEAIAAYYQQVHPSIPTSTPRK